MDHKGLFKEFDKLTCDHDRWLWILKHQDHGIVIMLDNDDTFGVFSDIDDDDGDYILRFDGYLGWSDGVGTLLDALGIEASCV